tara:strand:+ start:905 stop:2140 length:1236 start_codon:yes stop_codon:yes gene_type:complete
MKYLLFFLFLVVSPLNAEIDSLEIIQLGMIEGCDFSGSPSDEPSYAFASTTLARQAVKRITDSIGIPANFIIYSSNIPNAKAVINDNKQRLLLYNQEFIKRVTKGSNDWAALTIISHEIGHHLSGHTLIIGSNRKLLELEADQFAGTVIRNLGGTVEQALMAYDHVDGEETETHPSASARRAAVIAGWELAEARIKEIVDVGLDKNLISNVQRLLKLLNYHTVDHSGTVTEHTKRAVSAFQRTYNLDIDGRISKALESSLIEAKAKGFNNKVCEEVYSDVQKCVKVGKKRPRLVKRIEYDEVSQTVGCFYNVHQFCNAFGCNWSAIESMCENNPGNSRQLLKNQCGQQGGDSITGFDAYCSCGPYNCSCDISAECSIEVSDYEDEIYYEDECSVQPEVSTKCSCRAEEVCE